LGVQVGVLEPGRWNAITDVPGVKVGHATVSEGEDIRTASRVLPGFLGGYAVGVLVVTNFGGILEINGAPVGRELGGYYLEDADRTMEATADGSCMMVIATDAPLRHRNLYRLAKRAFLGMAATGTPSTNGSGDYAIAFSVNGNPETLQNTKISPLFQAVKEATEEAIYNSLFMAVDTQGRDGNASRALPLPQVLDVLRKYRVLQ
jgi:D-aminopeptidase